MSIVKADKIESKSGRQLAIDEIASSSHLQDLSLQINQSLDAIREDVSAVSAKQNAFEVKGANFTAVINTSYYITSSVTVSLPLPAGLKVGDVIRFSKTISATPSIVRQGTANIVSGDKTDVDVLFDAQAELTFIFNGTNWEL